MQSTLASRKNLSQEELNNLINEKDRNAYFSLSYQKVVSAMRKMETINNSNIKKGAYNE